MIERGLIQRFSTSRGTFANKPSNPYIGQQYLATDLSNTVIMWDGLKWKPPSGMALIGHLVGSGLTTAFTGSEQNINTITIPAGLLSAKANIRFYYEAAFSGTNGTKTLIVRHNTTSGAVTGGTQIISNSIGGSNTTLYTKANCNFHNANSVSAQTFSVGASESAASGSVGSGTINTAVASYINFNISGNALDTYTGYLTQVWWSEP